MTVANTDTKMTDLEAAHFRVIVPFAANCVESMVSDGQDDVDAIVSYLYKENDQFTFALARYARWYTENKDE